MHNVCEHLAFVNTFDPVGLRPRQLAVTVHLRIDEVADVVATVGPLENPVTADLTVQEVATVNVNAIIIVPLFKTFTRDLTFVKNAANVNLAAVHLFETLTFDLILDPLTFVLYSVSRLPVFALPVELAIQEPTCVNTAVCELLLTFPVRVVINELSAVDRSIAIAQGSLAIFDTVFPLAPILGLIVPLADAEAIHLSVLPFTVISPRTFLTDKGSLTRLESIFKSALINVSIRPLASALTNWVPVTELADVRLALAHDQLPLALHFAVHPRSLIGLVGIWFALVVGPRLLTLTLGLSFHDLSLIGR